MARPPDRGERKSEILNIRVTPTLRTKLEFYARKSGRKLAAECEQRLTESVLETESNATPQTKELLVEIQRLIGEIEAQTETKWHVGAGTWKAVQEMLATGPIMERAPSHIGENDARLNALYAELLENYGRRDDLMRTLETMRLVSKTNALMMTVHGLRERIDALDAGQEVKDSLHGVADELDQVDARQAEIWDEIDEIIKPFREAMEEGRKLYPKPRRGVALGTILNQLDPKPNALMMAALTLPSVPPMPLPRTGMFGARGADAVGETPILGGRLLGSALERNDDSGSA